MPWLRCPSWTDICARTPFLCKCVVKHKSIARRPSWTPGRTPCVRQWAQMSVLDGQVRAALNSSHVLSIQPFSLNSTSRGARTKVPSCRRYVLMIVHCSYTLKDTIPVHRCCRSCNPSIIPSPGHLLRNCVPCHNGSRHHLQEHVSR